ncbi:MAG: asparagine synthase C-terminal domain-containing protein [Methanolinea sp.]
MTRPVTFSLAGWVEVEGRILREEEIALRLARDPLAAAEFGGEFSIEWDGYTARDPFGIAIGRGPPGKILKDGRVIGEVNPRFPETTLADAIVASVALRRDESAVALSGGVDSSLVAAIARCPCITAGIRGSPDLKAGREVASLLDLEWIPAEIAPAEIGEALPEVASIVPGASPLDTSIALCWYFVARAARDAGFRRVLTGQGADELFGGYRRYLDNPDTEALLAADLSGLPRQVARDQAVAASNGVFLSYPYLDGRVVRVASAIPAHEKVAGGTRKRALCAVAEKFLPPAVARREKKAMQYGSGIWKELRRLARRGGVGSVGEYLARIS